MATHHEDDLERVPTGPSVSKGMSELDIKDEALPFTPEEERKYVRKIDFWIVPLMM